MIYLLLLISVLLAGCTGLAGEPRIVATIPPPTPTITLNDLGYPVEKPDLAQGAQIFAANCTRCHGINGAGDGEMVLTGAVMNPGDFTDPLGVREQTPQEYFDIITYGKLESLMPPWGGTLTEEERWDVTMYVYSLHYSAEQLAAGEAIYTGECSRCHGETGRGDGPDMGETSRGMDNLSQPSEMIYLSDQHIFNMVSEGAGEDMPAYADELTEEEIYAVGAYTRALWTENINDTAPAQPETTPEAETTLEAAPDAAVGRIYGTITNGTAGASIPPDQIVTLHIIDSEMNEQTEDLALQSDGSYSFDQVPIDAQWVYFVSTRYNERSFASSPFQMNPAQPEAESPIVIYEVTDDASQIQISGIIMQIAPVGGVLEITQEVRFINTSDRMFITQNSIQPGVFGSVEAALPIGAIYPPMQNSERLRFDSETFVVTDTRAVIPGTEHVMQFLYLLPYDSSAIIDFPVSYPFSGAAIVVIEGEDITLSGDPFIAIDPSVASNIQGKAYGATLALNAGDTLQFNLTGRTAPVGTSADSSVVTVDNLLPIFGGLAVLLIATGVFIFFLSRRSLNQTAADKDKRIATLVRKIAALDAQHSAGQINHDVYRLERAALDLELQKLMNSPESAEPQP